MSATAFWDIKEGCSLKTRKSRRYAGNPRDTAVFDTGVPQGHVFEKKNEKNRF